MDSKEQLKQQDTDIYEYNEEIIKMKDAGAFKKPVTV
jgi:hypothetical protein